MEAEKAKENEEFMSKKFNDLQRRIEELTAECSAQKKLTDELQVSLQIKEEQNETFKKVIDQFYQIRQQSVDGFQDTSWDYKCACLLHDPVEFWSFNDSTTTKYISALEAELEMVRKCADSFQHKLRVGLEIENHLKRRVRELEKKMIYTDKMMKSSIEELRHRHSESRVQVVNLLDGGKSFIKSVADAIDEKIRQFETREPHNLEPSSREDNHDENECRDVHINTDVDRDLLSKMGSPNSMVDRNGDASEALAQALQDKVATLLLLSQQEERHLLERNVNAALQKKIEELHRNLLQVMNEKVRALMELAHLKQEHQLLRENISGNVNTEKVLANVGGRSVVAPEIGGRLTNLLKKTNLKRLVGSLDFRGREGEVHLNNEGNFSGRKSDNMDFARMKIENANLKESMESMEHLISSIHRLRLSLLVKAKESETTTGTVAIMPESLDEIIYKAKLVKTALGSSLPISWSAEADLGLDGEGVGNEQGDIFGSSTNEKIDFVAAAGFEMVELLILAAQILKDNTPKVASYAEC
ncbi:uncharacterized protein LOC133795761 isoform X2 [Humulus lupulus]|nr:uncharacterized protein LOC133795761 isoform X2 [Humulus lupulus]